MNHKQKSFRKALRENKLMAQAARFLTEGEMENAQSALAAKDLVDRIQDMVTELGKMSNEDLPTVTDSIRASFGAEIASTYSATAGEQLTSLLTTVKAGRDALEQATLQLTGEGSAPTPGAGMDDMGGEEAEEGDGFAASPAASGGTDPLGRGVRDEAMGESRLHKKFMEAKKAGKKDTEFVAYWAEKQGGKYEAQEGFKTANEAHNWISEQPDGGHYKVREEIKEAKKIADKEKQRHADELYMINARERVATEAKNKKAAKKKSVKEGAVKNAFNKVANAGLNIDRHNITGKADKCKNCGYGLRKDKSGKLVHANFKDDNNCRRPQVTESNKFANSFNKQIAVGDIVQVVEGTGTRYKVAVISEGIATLKDAKGAVKGKQKVAKLEKAAKKTNKNKKNQSEKDHYFKKGEKKATPKQ